MTEGSCGEIPKRRLKASDLSDASADSTAGTHDPLGGTALVTELLDQSRDGFIGVASDGTIAYANGEAARHLGREIGTLQGRQVADVVGEVPGPQTASRLADAMKADGPFELEVDDPWQSRRIHIHGSRSDVGLLLRLTNALSSARESNGPS